MQMILNELSLGREEVHPREAGQKLEQFINTYSEAVKKGVVERTVLTGTDLNSLEVSKGFFVSKWRNQTGDKDLCRRFLSMCDRQEIVEFARDEAELSCEKGIGQGLLAACENGDICISFAFDPYWSLFEIPCEYYSLEEDQTYPVIVYNLSDKAQLEERSEWFSGRRRQDMAEINTPQQLLEHLSELFPSLIFHRTALDQLESQVQPCHVGAICNKLMLLENYFSKWDGQRFEEEAFPIKCVSLQTKSTLERFKKEHTFDFDGEQVLVSYHMRYTGRIPGRIYFHPANRLKKAYVCSLTTKLPTVSEPKMRI